MTDTTETTPQVLSAEELQQYRDHATKAIMIGTSFALEIIDSHLALTAERDRQAWDMRSLETTVENLRGEVDRLREVLTGILHEAGGYDEEPSHELPTDHPIVAIYQLADAALAGEEGE